MIKVCLDIALETLISSAKMSHMTQDSLSCLLSSQDIKLDTTGKQAKGKKEE